MVGYSVVQPFSERRRLYCVPCEQEEKQPLLSSTEGLGRQLLISEALFTEKRPPKNSLLGILMSTYFNTRREQESQDKFQLDSGERIPSASKRTLRCDRTREISSGKRKESLPQSHVYKNCPIWRNYGCHD